MASAAHTCLALSWNDCLLKLERSISSMEQAYASWSAQLSLEMLTSWVQFDWTSHLTPRCQLLAHLVRSVGVRMCIFMTITSSRL